jgi:hypothetical protein
VAGAVQTNPGGDALVEFVGIGAPVKMPLLGLPKQPKAIAAEGRRCLSTEAATIAAGQGSGSNAAIYVFTSGELVNSITNGLKSVYGVAVSP